MFIVGLTVALALLASTNGAFAAPASSSASTSASAYAQAPSSTATSYGAPVATAEGVIGPLGVQIHPSCNATETHQLLAGLRDAETLTAHAQTHLLTHGTSSPLFVKYFSAPHFNATTFTVLGLYTRLLSAPKPGVLLRCDDPDSQCQHEPTWAGHYRGSNATSETVICGNSYLKRRRLETMCALGYEILEEGGRNLFWAGDLLHRMFHVPSVTEGGVDHRSEGGYKGVMEFKEVGKVEEVSGNSDALQYFALEAYALEVAAPEVGCLGVEKPEKSEAIVSSTAVTTAAAAATSASTASTSATKTDVASTTTTATAGKACHTHDDGEVHCV